MQANGGREKENDGDVAGDGAEANHLADRGKILSLELFDVRAPA